MGQKTGQWLPEVRLTAKVPKRILQDDETSIS